MTDLLQLLIAGLATGAIYALAAIGFTLLWQTSQTINFAQGEFVMVPAFFALIAMKWLGMGVLLALVLSVLVSMLLLGVVGTGFTYIWYYQLMAVAGSAIANSVTYLSPVVAVLVGSLLLHESVTWNQILGGAIVILGAAISQGRLDGVLARISGRK